MHRASKTNQSKGQLDISAKQVCYTDQMDGPVLFICEQVLVLETLAKIC